MLLLSGMTENQLKLIKTSCALSAGSGLSLETSDVTLVWDDRKQVKAKKDKLCRVLTVKENVRPLQIIKGTRHVMKKFHAGNETEKEKTEQAVDC